MAKKKVTFKMNMDHAVANLKTALRTMQIERAFARERKDWPTAEYLADQIARLSEILDENGGGLESFVSNIGDV